ncbi:MAG: hypothetical protein KKE02_13620 [Alphaproteobacteria bacterium]|nr:hypothetical protein [Alphaproteobacteria bacterium]MBU1516922.1 hypothetical protein [Alphaproteobacteria bacterium]MBU2095810.1 hypothetical protein [Alphaproteobacteria bacterium]MBU2152053.1 hypothetical protein [Alphaproteobacteria bacterium]MBU2309574.1 hypothetical protein [Alphaproteobacteria bacterium]
MGHPRPKEGRDGGCEVIDFDVALLDACAPDVRSDLLIEARLLADVFAPGRDPVALTRMATQLSAGERDAELGRAHARRLAAALKRLARDS